MNVKYIKTKEGDIIVFSAHISHDEFIKLSPVSAGFIAFDTDINGEFTCDCYGNSYSLNLNSDVNDSKLAMRQILGKDVCI